MSSSLHPRGMGNNYWQVKGNTYLGEDHTESQDLETSLDRLRWPLLGSSEQGWKSLGKCGYDMKDARVFLLLYAPGVGISELLLDVPGVDLKEKQSIEYGSYLPTA